MYMFEFKDGRAYTRTDKDPGWAWRVVQGVLQFTQSAGVRWEPVDHPGTANLAASDWVPFPPEPDPAPGQVYRHNRAGYDYLLARLGVGSYCLIRLDGRGFWVPAGPLETAFGAQPQDFTLVGTEGAVAKEAT